MTLDKDFEDFVVLLFQGVLFIKGMVKFNQILNFVQWFYI